MHAGDQVVAALARDRGGALVAYAWMLTGDRREAEDLVQEALVPEDRYVLYAIAGVVLVDDVDALGGDVALGDAAAPVTP